MIERMDRLPKWAREEISRLNRDIEHLLGKLRERDQGAGRIVVDAYSDEAFRVSETAVIKFEIGDNTRDSITVRMRNDALHINGSDCFAVLPMSSNDVEIKIRETPRE